MKRQVYKLGTRKWFSDDFILLQNEIYSALDGTLEPYGAMIIKGLEITDNGDSTFTISDGMVGLLDNTGANYKICRFYEQTIAAASFPVYLVQDMRDSGDVSDYGREYKDLITKDIVNEYIAKVETVQPGHAYYLPIASSGNNTRLRDALQDSSYRFVTDAEKSTWNSKAAGTHSHAPGDINTDANNRFITDTERTTWNNARAGAVSDIRDGIATDKNTLNKLFTQLKANFWDGDGSTKVFTTKKVGIGTPNPSQLLHVNSDSGAAAILINSNLASHNAALHLAVDNVIKWQLRTTGSNNNIGLFDGANYRFYIDRSNGNIGIGTTSPSQKLDVDGNIIADDVIIR